MKNHVINNRWKTTGFTLLEVMVALMIFSIGLLGLAGLQASGFSSNKTADLRGHAIILAHDIAERIRANDRGNSGAYDAITTTTGPGTPGDCVLSNCTTPSDVAAWDIFEWKTTVANSLPGGKASVTRTGSGSFDITVMWDEDRTGATGEDCGADLTVDLKCFNMEFLP